MPLTASVPMSPPGKKSGRTTYESVVNATRAPCRPPSTAASWPVSSSGLPNAGQEDALQQLVHEAAAAAVRQQHAVS